MINIAIEDKPNLSVSSTDRRAFLRALYGSSPDDLYLELRCIHPTTGDVQTLWGQMGNKAELAAAFRQADVLNREGFGVYFAPCLRKARQGKAEAAALVPALWIDIDCDGDAVERERALDRLRAFKPAPSAIIDSGGGLHGYWLLDDAYALKEETGREKVTAILRGLFSALEGDTGYVKSVASVMRLPDTVNTKPERGGAVVHIIELHPERHYPLSDFNWLAVTLKLETVHKPSIAASNGNGQHPLPARTEHYLMTGATSGQRNDELFAASCQLRDAGYSQSDAERELIARYMADSIGNENTTGREREARATIASAYSQPPREPIRTAKEQVDDLVQRYERKEADEEQAPAEQIAAAVKACASLDPIQWAAERKRLKAICGEDFRLADLDRLYREARRDLQRTEKSGEAQAEQYVELDGCMVYEKQTDRGINRQIVADWTAKVLEWVTRTSDEGQAEHIMRLRLESGGKVTTLDAPSELFGDANALQRFIAQKAGGIYAVRAGMNKHLVSAVLKLSDNPPQRQTYGFMGWTQIDGKWAYVSPEISIGAEGQLTATQEVELETRLRDYGLASPDWQEGLAAFQAAIKVLPEEFAPALLSFALLPVLQRFFPPAAPKPALHLSGTSGSGKSEIASLLTSFYGQFTRDTPPGQWGDTVNTVEVLGYALADALFWVDDYKQCYADERTFTRFLQSYSRGMGRGRLTREAKLRQERPCRGLLLSTGETTIEGEASVLSRMLVLEVPPWERRDPGGRALAAAEMIRHHLPALTSRFIQWAAGAADAGTLAPELARRFETNSKGYRQKLTNIPGQQTNTGRMIGNWAVLVTVYQMLTKFWDEMGVDDTLPHWRDTIVETVQRVQQERAGRLFLNLLAQQLASGRVVLSQNMRDPEEARPGTTTIGYQDEQHIYLLPEVAYQEVTRVQPLKFSPSSIGAQLKEDGWLISGTNSLTVQRRVRGIATRFWQLKGDSLGCDSCDAVTVTD